VQTRLVRCIVEGISSTSCSEIGKPSAEQRCNVEPCKKEVQMANKPPKSKEKNLYFLRTLDFFQNLVIFQRFLESAFAISEKLLDNSIVVRYCHLIIRSDVHLTDIF